MTKSELIEALAKNLLHFKPGKELRDRVDKSRLTCQINNGSRVSFN
jgi:hypothetical protein